MPTRPPGRPRISRRSLARPGIPNVKIVPADRAAAPAPPVPAPAHNSPTHGHPLTRRNVLALGGVMSLIAARSAMAVNSPWPAALALAHRSVLAAERSVSRAEEAGAGDREMLMLWAAWRDARQDLAELVIEAAGVDLPPAPNQEGAYRSTAPVAAVVEAGHVFLVVRADEQDPAAVRYFGPLGMSHVRIVVVDLAGL